MAEIRIRDGDSLTIRVQWNSRRYVVLRIPDPSSTEDSLLTPRTELIVEEPGPKGKQTEFVADVGAGPKPVVRKPQAPEEGTAEKLSRSGQKRRGS